MTDTDTAQLVVDLRATDDAVRANGWVAPGLGVPGAPLGLLGSTLNPLTGLAAAGLSWFMPMVSFLGEPLTQLQGGDGASVTSGAQDFDDAGQDIAGVADSYRASTGAQTSEWSGAAAEDYRDAATRHADGVAGLGEASNTVGSAIIGAGQVVAQAIAEITELIAEAVAQIVPIMTQAVARAGETFGQSVVEAIPPCVAIAVEYALRIAAKLAALVASGQNLLKLVQGALAVVDLIKAALANISQQSVSAGAEPESATAASTGGGEPAGADPVSTLGRFENTAADPGAPGSAPVSASAPSTGGGFGGGFGGGTPSSAGASTPLTNPLDVGTQSSAVVPPVLPAQGAVPDAPRLSGGVPGGVPTGVVPGGGGPIGAATFGPTPGARVGAERGTDTARQEGKQQPVRATKSAGSGAGAVPLGAMGGARPAGEADKEHKRKYSVVALHNEDVEVAPPVITEGR